MKTRIYVAVVGSVLSSAGLIIGILALTDIVPMKYVWGGRLTGKDQLISMEIVTLLVNSFIIWGLGMRAGYFKTVVTQHKLKYSMLVLGILMSLNTLGNLAAKTNIEKLFAIPTFIGALCFFYLYRDDNKSRLS